MKKLFAILLLFFVLPVCAPAAAPELPVLNTAALSLLVSQHKGKVVVVNFFATWCPACRQEIPHLIKTAKSYKDKAVFVGISLDEDVQVVSPFARKMGIDYPLYLADPSLLEAFQITSIPQNVFYGPDGVLRINHQGYMPESMLNAIIDKLAVQK